MTNTQWPNELGVRLNHLNANDNLHPNGGGFNG
jgi:hypothetical protein